MGKKPKNDLRRKPAVRAKLNEKDPYIAIGNFFSAAPLRFYRKYISLMLRAAYSEDYWKKSAPGNLLFFQDRMLELIHAAHLFTQAGKKKVKIKKKAVLDQSAFEQEIDVKSYCRGQVKNTIWESFPRQLTKGEFINPYKVFDRFFGFWDLENWLKEFREIISFALQPYGNETGIDYDYLELYKLLQKLVEACHLIEVRLMRPNYSQEN